MEPANISMTDHPSLPCDICYSDFKEPIQYVSVFGFKSIICLTWMRQTYA